MIDSLPPEIVCAGPESAFDPVYRVLAGAIESRAFPGCAFGVLAEGQVVKQGALGRATYDADAQEVSPETAFDIASITKVVATTAAAMKLTQTGRLDLDLPVSSLLPGFADCRASGDPAHSVTLRNLLAHDSGLPGYVKFFERVSTAEDLKRTLLNLPLTARPGERAEYSDPGFMLLGMAIEAIAGEPFAQFVYREVFQPLGLTHTGFCPSSEKRPLIPPTEFDAWFRHRRIQGEVQDENAWLLGGVAGHSGIFSNVMDLLRFSTEILAAYKGDSTAQIFQPELMRQFAKRQGPAGNSYALGWDTPSAPSSTGNAFSPNSIGHLGYSGCSLWIDLDAGVAAVLLTNRTWPDRQSQQIKQVRPAFHHAVRNCL